MTDEKKQYYTLRVSNANKTELVEILYEMLLDYSEEAGEKAEAGDESAAKEAIRKARGCVSELMDSLNLEYDVAKDLRKLYVYVTRELTIGEIRRDKTNFDNIKKVIEPLRDAYLELMKKDDSGPVMANTQTVVAGLTYSKNNINEAINEDDKRGFFV